MKLQVLDAAGKKVKELDSKIFDSVVREDIVQKAVEIEKISQEYAPSFLAGNQTSASGNVRHLRHAWKSDRGRGLSRVPKKKLWRRGTQFYWIGAVIPGTRGGRRAHPPKLGKKLRKLNKKETRLAFGSALAMAASPEGVADKYRSIEKLDISLPLVVGDKVLALKTKDFLSAIKSILGELYGVAIQNKSIRAGKGKMRNRKYKKSAGLLLVIGNEESKRVNGIEIRKAADLSVSDLASNGARLSMFTEAAINDLWGRLG